LKRSGAVLGSVGGSRIERQSAVATQPRSRRSERYVAHLVPTVEQSDLLVCTMKVEPSNLSRWDWPFDVIDHDTSSGCRAVRAEAKLPAHGAEHRDAVPGGAACTVAKPVRRLWRHGSGG
jgi:hypothetical protein